MTRYAASLARVHGPTEPFVLVGQMTVADPSRSPAGTGTLWAYTHLPFRPDWSASEVAEQVTRVEAVLERHAPGFSDVVRARRIGSPAELQAGNPSLVGIAGRRHVGRAPAVDLPSHTRSGPRRHPGRSAVPRQRVSPPWRGCMADPVRTRPAQPWPAPARYPVRLTPPRCPPRTVPSTTNRLTVSPAGSERDPPGRYQVQSDQNGDRFDSQQGDQHEDLDRSGLEGRSRRRAARR